VIEQAPSPTAMARSAGGEGAVGSAGWGASLFRYELRCWRDGAISDVSEAVESPRRLTDSSSMSRRLLDLLPFVPTPVWAVTNWVLRDVELDSLLRRELRVMRRTSEVQHLTLVRATADVNDSPQAVLQSANNEFEFTSRQHPVRHAPHGRRHEGQQIKQVVATYSDCPSVAWTLHSLADV